MKLTHKTLLTVLALAAGANVFAQINRNQVPGPTEYDSFSRFIADRNIFDPARQPHYSGTRTRTRTRIHSTSAPFLSLADGHWHDYGKEARPGRKVGHATVCAPDAGSLREKLVQAGSGLGRDEQVAPAIELLG